MLKESRISMDWSEQMSHITSPRASSRFNQVVETKRCKGLVKKQLRILNTLVLRKSAGTFTILLHANK